MPLTSGTRLGRYEIREQIGAGGMGEVYLAQDTNLGRRVALKLLPSEFTKDANRLRRFQQEARAASALNHPNILTIHEIGSENSTYFIATEYIEGRTLRDYMAGAQMNTSEVFDVAIQVASALAAAHTAGVVHRDIKPENIMLRHDRIVKVLDFGLAKLTERETPDMEAPTLVNTDAGVVMGTARYMSPEQVRGLAVDARTDVWSLGVVIHEMLTGRGPFAGETASDVIAAVLEREPQPLVSHVEEIPSELKRIVSKALRKDREERYQTVKDLSLDLKSLKQELEFEAKLSRSAAPDADKETFTSTRGAQTVSATTIDPVSTTEFGATRPTSSAEYIFREIKHHKKSALLAGVALVALIAVFSYFYFARAGGAAIDSIAVLPFVNGSGDPNAEYLSDGITESLINSLSRLPKLRVVPRSTVFRYKGRDVDPQIIGRELGVNAVLTGRVVQRGDTLNVQIELVDVAEQSQLWGEQYSRKITDILYVQEEIAREISQKLRIRISGDEQKQLTKRYTDNTEAYQLYLRGRYYWNKRTPEDLTKAADYFRQSIDIDPNYALAYSGLADCYNVLPIWTAIETKESYPKAKSAALKALEIDDTLAEAHISLAYALYRYEWDWPAAEREFKRGIELKSSNATAHQWYSFYLSAMGRAQEALAEMKRAQELEPLSLFINSDLGAAWYTAHQYDQAIAQLKKTIEIDPTFGYAHYNLALVYQQRGMHDLAVDEMRKATDLSTGRDLILGSLGHSYAVAGKDSEALTILDQMKEKSERQHVSAFFVALIYTGLGDKDQAFVWFDKACQDREYSMPRIKDDLRLDNIRSDPRFAELLRCVGLPQ